MQKPRRTLKKYQDLYKNPSTLFKTCDVILFPNGEEEIWIKSKDGKKGIRITCSEGKAGLGLIITKLSGPNGLTVGGNEDKTYEVINVEKEFNSLEITMYNNDDHSQKFKAWYQGKGDYPKEENIKEGI